MRKTNPHTYIVKWHPLKFKIDIIINFFAIIDTQNRRRRRRHSTVI